jgi:transposase
MLDYSDKKLIKYIIEFINSNDKFKNLFSHHKQIYPIEILLEGILYKLKKHKSCKISIIEDNFKIPIDYIISNSNIHDASIFSNHIQNMSNKYPSLCTNNNKFITDSGYDSDTLRNQLKETKLGILICDKNKRNTKDPEKIKKLKPTLHEKLLLKKRSVIEHTNNTLKQNRTINTRYEKFSKHYENFTTLAIIRIIFKKIGIIENYNN